MSDVWPQKVVIFSPVATSHKRIAIFSILFFHQVPDARYLPHGEKARAYGSPVCRCGIAKSVVSVSAHHNRSSPDIPEAITLPHGENAIVLLGLSKGSVAISSPVSVSQSRVVLSLDPLASRLPSGENANDQMCSVCPTSDFGFGLCSGSHR